MEEIMPMSLFILPVYKNQRPIASLPKEYGYIVYMCICT